MHIWLLISCALFVQQTHRRDRRGLSHVARARWEVSHSSVALPTRCPSLTRGRQRTDLPLSPPPVPRRGDNRGTPAARRAGGGSWRGAGLGTALLREKDPEVTFRVCWCRWEIRWKLLEGRLTFTPLPWEDAWSPPCGFELHECRQGNRGYGME